MDRDDPAYRGQADYSPGFLRIYDGLVLGLFARFVWRMSTSDHVRLYREQIRPNHLDVGPGTGYFLEHADLPDGSRVTIVDPNPNVLRHVTSRLERLGACGPEPCRSSSVSAFPHARSRVGDGGLGSVGDRSADPAGRRYRVRRWEEALTRLPARAQRE